MRTYTQALAANAAQTPGAVAEVGHLALGSLYLQVGGTFSATYHLEMSVDGNTWFDVSTKFTDVVAGSAAGSSLVTGKLLNFAGVPARFLRTNCTAYSTGGAPSIVLTGQDTRTT